MAQLVAHLLCKQGVTGSSPVSSTTKGPASAGPLLCAELIGRGAKGVGPEPSARDQQRALIDAYSYLRAAANSIAIDLNNGRLIQFKLAFAYLPD